MTVELEARPFCVKCHVRMSIGNGSTPDGRVQLRCLRCGGCVMNRYASKSPEPRERARDCRPDCVKCRVQMRCNGRESKTKIQRFACPTCSASVARERSRVPPLILHPEVEHRKQGRPPAFALAPNPDCVKCRRKMRKFGRGRYTYWLCSGCNTFVRREATAPKSRTRSERLAAAPLKVCRRCSRPMRCNGFERNGSFRYQCPGCPLYVPRGIEGGELLTFAFRIIPTNLPADVREEAAQALAVALLTKEQKPTTLNRTVVRRYVRAAYGFNDAKRFASLDNLTRGGSPFVAMLEG